MREWITGRNPVYEVLSAGRRHIYRLRIAEGVRERDRLVDILRLSAHNEIPVERVPRKRLDALGEGHQGIALEVSDYPYSDLFDILSMAEQRREPPFLLMLDTLQDPQNLGSLLRTAEVVGVHGVFLPYRHSASVTPAVVSVSAGASEHLHVARGNLAQIITSLKEEGLWVIGLESSAEALRPDQVALDGPLVLVVGGEGKGMRPLVRSSCDMLMGIPMRGKIESLNAAIAGSIALYLARQAREFSGMER
jgi:23S rRNA (guanosine2251-2'-O)-methyltransferase